jgi:hypothetical protein
MALILDSGRLLNADQNQQSTTEHNNKEATQLNPTGAAKPQSPTSDSATPLSNDLTRGRPSGPPGRADAADGGRLDGISSALSTRSILA